MNVNETVCVKEYNAEWAAFFQRESQKLSGTLKKYNCQIEHIGSTSVVGMCAKPIIDILIGINNFPPTDDFIRAMIGLGYEYMEQASVSNRLYFVKRESLNFNAHIVKYGGSIWNKDIAFREFLRNTPQAIQEYSALKRGIINKGRNKLLEYSEEKAPFIENILKNL